MPWRRPVLVFPGQNSQCVGMGRDLYERFPAAKSVFDLANDSAGLDLADLCFNGPAEKLKLTEFQQPCILATSIAIYRVLSETVELSPLCAVGHSLGEYTALTAAGALRFKDAVRLTRKRGFFMQEAVPEGRGGMAALLGCDEALAGKLCESVGKVWVANLNGAGQVIVSGEIEAVKALCEKAKAEGIRRTTMLDVSAPFHSPMMKPAADRFGVELEQAEFLPLSFPVIANVNAEPNDDESLVRELLMKQITSQVLFERSIQKAVAMGADSFIEVGPGGRLVPLVKRIVPDLPCESVSNADEILKFKATADASRGA